MRLLWALALYVSCCGLAACGDDDHSEDDRADDGTLDLSVRDGAPPRDASPVDGGSTDASAGDGGDMGAATPEDCSTDLDEDGDGRAGCADEECFGLARCREGELVEGGRADWAPCEGTTPLLLDPAATAARCEEGLPPWVETSREIRCGAVPTEVSLEVYCPPGDGPERALRWELTMDLSAPSEMLGPSTYRTTSLLAELFFTRTVVENGGGGSSGEGLMPMREGYRGEGYVAIGWEALGANQTFTAFPAVSESVTTVTFYDGGVDSSSSPPTLFLPAAFSITVR
jgi:hypothetical protein